MHLGRWACWFCFILAVLPAGAQDLGVFVDTLSGTQPFVLRPFIRPGSERIFQRGAPLDSTQFALDYRFGRLWVPSLTSQDTVFAHYRTWGVVLQDAYAPPLARAEGPGQADSAKQHIAPATRSSVSLSRTGSITRGVLAGNRRDAIIESGLRLQLAGTVAENVRVKAVLTDESTPILPEGTTQRLSELDRVYIEITSGPGQVQLGDFEVAYDGSSFAQLKRKVQGMGLGAASSVSGLAGSVQAMGAAARGVFRRQSLAVSDGVQGPYRLTGEQHEQFIFIVPGSEEVYLDGQRLSRGQTQDYVIDYATGELTFTTNRLIRFHDRVVVEFQYRTTEYTRTLLGAETDVAFGHRATGPARASLGATFLRESDGRVLSEAFGLTAEDEALLAAVGDSMALRTGAIPVPYDAEAPYVQYVQQDTLLDAGRVVYYAPVAERPTRPVFRVTFTRVGPGNGSYVRQGQATNGIAYQWRGPGRGDYEPVRILPKPRQQRMLDLRGTVSPVRFLELFGEWATSLYDRNRLSPLHKADDTGRAYLGGLRLTPRPVGLGTVALSAQRRDIGRGFASFSRIRPVEFERLWNLSAQQTASMRQSLSAASETIDEGTVTWQASPHSSLTATAGRLALGHQFEAQRAEISLALEEPKWPQVRYHLISITSSDASLLQDGTWQRHNGSAAVSLLNKQLIPAVQYKKNRRIVRAVAADSLIAPSNAFVHVTPGLTWRAPMGKVGASYDLRIDDRVHRGAIARATQAATWDVHFDMRPSRIFRTEGRIGLRSLTYNREPGSGQTASDKRSAVMRWSGRLQPWQRALQLHWFYEALSERTPTLQEIYIRTGPELGEYVWVDANGNGVLELDEFLPETTQDEGNYVRTLIPSDSLQSVIGLQMRLSLQLDLSRKWRDAPARWQRALRHVSMRTAINVQEKSRTPRLTDVYFLRMGTFRRPEHTLKGLLSLQQDVYLWKDSPRHGWHFSYRHIRGRNELAAGAESRATDEFRTDARLRVSQAWSASLALARGNRRTASALFASRSYDIGTVSIAPSLTYSTATAFQVVVSAVHARKNAVAARASLWRVPVEARYARAQRFNIAGRLEAASVAVRGTAHAHGLAHFELTDGRGTGTSLMWALSSWYQLSSVLRATVTYNGRSPQGAPTIHTVRMQLSAAF